jgi:hypothetical protein
MGLHRCFAWPLLPLYSPTSANAATQELWSLYVFEQAVTECVNELLRIVVNPREGGGRRMLRSLRPQGCATLPSSYDAQVPFREVGAG